MGEATEGPGSGRRDRIGSTRVVAWLVVAITSFVSGGFAIPIGMFGFYTAGLWLLIEIVGVD